MKPYPMTEEPTITVSQLIDKLSMLDPASKVRVALELRAGSDSHDLEMQIEDDVVSVVEARGRVILITRSFD